MRMLLQNGITGDDVKVSWENNKTIRLRIKWPVFMKTTVMMAGLLDAVDGEPDPYQEHHPVYVDMGKNSKRLEDDESEIYEEGLFSFLSSMDETKFYVEVFQVPIDANGGYVTMLQILFYELVGDKKGFTSPVSVVKSKKMINFSKSSRTKRSATSNTPTDSSNTPSPANKRHKSNNTTTAAPQSQVVQLPCLPD